MTSDDARELAAGVVAGICSMLIEYPFDTVKVRMQHQGQGAVTSPPLRYTSYSDCISQIMRYEGIRNGFYKGLPAPVVGAAIENAVFFWSYRVATSWFQRTVMSPGVPCLQDEESYVSVAFGGVTCGFLVSCILTPIELVKCRMQVQNTLPKEMWEYKSALHCATTIARRDGPVAMYRGNTAMLVREVPGCVAWFLTFQAVARSLIGPTESVQEAPFYTHLLAGGLAGVAFWTVLYPADVIKTRVQIDQGHGKTPPLVASLRDLYKKEGFRAMYRGWGITVVRAFLANAAVLAVYEKVDEAWDHWIVPQDRFAMRHNKATSASSS